MVSEDFPGCLQREELDDSFVLFCLSRDGVYSEIVFGHSPSVLEGSSVLLEEVPFLCISQFLTEGIDGAASEDMNYLLAAEAFQPN